MRILLVNYRYSVSGGPERYMFNFIRLMEQGGHEVIPYSVRYDQKLDTPWSPYFAAPISGTGRIRFREHDRSLRTLRRSLERAFYSVEVEESLTSLLADAKPDVALVLH